MTIKDAALRLRAGKRVRGEHSTYTIVDSIGRGGSGVVYLATPENFSSNVAIKFFLPLYEVNLELFSGSVSQQKALQDSERFHRKEVECLQEVRHPGIVRVLDSGIYRPLKGELIKELEIIKELSFFVMDYVPGSNILEHLTLNTNNNSAIVSILTKLCESLIYLHEVKNYLHADLRAANILIREGTLEPVIIDFALYKNFNFDEVNADEITRLTGDWDLFPKDLPTDDPLKRIKETKGTRRELKELCFPGLDLFQIGRLIASLDEALASVLGTEEIRFLRLVRQQLLSWPAVKALSARWLKEQLSKLDPTYSQFMGADELTPPSSAKETLQLPGKVITISSLVDRLANTRSFRRLHSINQLTFLDVIYPGAGYRRHLHCLRAYGYCAELIGSLTHSVDFRLLFSPLLARQALVMSLLHDINHFPFLHIFQETRGDYFREIDLLDLFCNGEATQDNPSIYELLDEINLSREQFRDILLLNHAQLVAKGYEPGLQIVKSMIDSGADVDKLAYLEDDSRFTGVAYGKGVDSSRLLASATIVRLPNGGWYLGFREEGLTAIESLVICRYWMFRTVYWHRINRAIMTMLLHVIKKLYVQTKLNASEFIIDTMWRSEEAVLNYLNERYRARYGIDSIIRFILRDRETIYKRLLSVQGASDDHREAELYARISDLDAEQLDKCNLELRGKLEEYFRVQFSVGVSIREEDLLFDIPGRRLDTAGPIYVKMESNEIRPIESLPGPIQRVMNDFERLAKRMRVFINPTIANKLDIDDLSSRRRTEILTLLEESIPTGVTNQVR